MARFLYIPTIGNDTFFDKTFLHFSFRGKSWKLRDYSTGSGKVVLDHTTPPKYSPEKIREIATYDLEAPACLLTDITYWHNETKRMNKEYSTGVDKGSSSYFEQIENNVLTFGYSERGIINALLYDIYSSPKSRLLIEQLLFVITFPFLNKINWKIISIEILIEQSFSDFGDADIVFLLRTPDQNIVLFIEAKVKSSQAPDWSITKQFDKFVEGTQSQLHSSNLFTQLYHKQRMISTLQNGREKRLKDGLKFPQCSSKKIRKIGNNHVVLKAVTKIMNYLDSAYYISLVPDSERNVQQFFNKTLATTK